MATGLLGYAALAPARADESFTPGSGSASAKVFAFNIYYGEANVGMGIGDVKASYFETNARASSQLMQPGFLGLFNLAKLCGEEFAVDFPPPTSADTNKAGGQPDEHTKSVGDGTGTETAGAYPGSRGAGEFTGAQFGIPNVVEMSGGNGAAEAVMDPGARARTATGNVQVGSLKLVQLPPLLPALPPPPPVVEMGGLDWHLEQVVAGADHRAHEVTKAGTFTMGYLKVAGLPLPTGSPQQMADSIAAANAALAPFGIHLRLPELVPDGDRGWRLTPMGIAIGGKTVLGPVLYPLIAGGDSSLLALFNKIAYPTVFDPAECNELGGALKAAPQFQMMWNAVGFVAPIMIQAFAASINGGSEFGMDIGGARTSIDDTYYPPRPPLPPRAAAPAAPSAPAAPAAPGPAGSGGSVSGPAVGNAAPTVASSAPVPTSESSFCVTTSPVGKRRCWKGLGPLAAGLAGSLTLGLLAGDEVLRRRRRALITKEVAV